MSKGSRLRLLMFWSVVGCASFARAEQDQGQKLDRQFQSAVAQYDAGHFAEAARQLEDLLPHVPNNFEVQELMGLVYASLTQDTKAIEHLQVAVHLKPSSAAARTNLAASLTHAGMIELAGEQFRKAYDLEPGEYSSNHNLGEFYIQSEKIEVALPFLERAQRINPSSYNNGFDLAMADFTAGRIAAARQTVQTLMKLKDTGELHNLLAQIDEKDGKYVEAANEFEVAAHMDPSEDNLFDWGSELLLHRTYEPAIEVFRQATLRFPKSPRLQIGLGMVLYARGLYEDAIKALLTAADLNPSDPRCYLFLSRAYDSSPNQAGDVIERFRRYSVLQPNNALAQYYYAMSLWKGKRAEGSGVDLQAVETLLKESIDLDGSLTDAHAQLGNLYADQHQFERSISEYERALALNPRLPDTHYRLGTDYVHVGKKDKAQAEFEVYQKLRAEHLAEVDKQRAEVQQFVYGSKASPPSKP